VTVREGLVGFLLEGESAEFGSVMVAGGRVAQVSGLVVTDVIAGNITTLVDGVELVLEAGPLLRVNGVS